VANDGRRRYLVDRPDPVKASRADHTGETAARYNAPSPEDTQEGEIAYARFPPSRETRYPDRLLPG
jgi:hypothetical protein